MLHHCDGHARRAVLIVLPKAGVPASGIRLFDPGRAAADLQAAVAGDQDVRDRASPFHVAGEPAHRRELLHADAARPGAGRRGLVAPLDGDLRRGVHGDQAHALLCRGRTDEVPVARERGRIVHLPHRVRWTDASGQEATVPQFALRLLEARGEDHVHLPAVGHRNHDVVLVAELSGEVEGDVVLRVVVSASKAHAWNRTQLSIWSPSPSCPLVTSTRSRLPSFP